MGELMPRISDALMSIPETDVLPRVPRQVRRAVEGQIARGLVRAARAEADAYAAHTRIEGASFVARSGMQRIAQLTVEELRNAARTPFGAARYRAIADSFAALVNDEVIKLGYGL